MQNPNDPFAFLKAQWPDLGSSFQMPQAAMSSLDPQVIDKRIEDLKTVEQWLGFNLNLVRSTIQGLEIQRGTLAAIQSFQQSMQDFGQTVSPKDGEPSPDANQAKPEHADGLNQTLNQAAMAQASDWWNGVQHQFQTFVQAAQQATGQAAAPADSVKTKKGQSHSKSAPRARATSGKTKAGKTSTRRSPSS
ncbi:MAG: PhaM family polyhydroxyalkanoate granule multifunctional regulatory protein [Burkholderiaceae bacterium]